MNKTHWNTVIADGSFSGNDLIEWVDDSYLLVVKSLPTKIKEKIYKQLDM